MFKSNSNFRDFLFYQTLNIFDNRNKIKKYPFATKRKYCRTYRYFTTYKRDIQIYTILMKSIKQHCKNDFISFFSIK